jgi:hypothetical protein
MMDRLKSGKKEKHQSVFKFFPTDAGVQGNKYISPSSFQIIPDIYSALI